MVAQCFCWKDIKRHRAHQQDYFFKVVNKITFYLFPCLCTGCPLMPAWNTKLSYLSLFIFRLLRIYLSTDLLSVYTPKRKLRSSSDNIILCIHKLRTKTFGHRSISFAAPTVWLSLPSKLRHTDSIQKFKSALITHPHRKFHTWCIKFSLIST